VSDESNQAIDQPEEAVDAAPPGPASAASNVAAATSGDEPVAAEASSQAPPDEAASIASMIAEPQPTPAPAAPSPPRKRSPTAAELQPPVDPEPVERKMDWYILKVQSNREDSIRDALQRRIGIHGLQDYFGEIIVPVEMVSEFKNGKKKIVKRKLYPGYIVVRMEITEETWFLVRETPGIGDFTGSGGKPSPMLPHEVNKILAKQEEKTDEAPKLKIRFVKGDRVKITEGTFENFEGDVDSIDEANGRITVMINIFGRSTPVELEYWQVDSV
jgi:transcriptional antiterminator NusG